MRIDFVVIFLEIRSIEFDIVFFSAVITFQFALDESYSIGSQSSMIQCNFLSFFQCYLSVRSGICGICCGSFICCCIVHCLCLVLNDLTTDGIDIIIIFLSAYSKINFIIGKSIFFFQFRCGKHGVTFRNICRCQRNGFCCINAQIFCLFCLLYTACHHPRCRCHYCQST